MGYQEHQRSTGSLVARCAVVTLSDTRTESTDASGARIKELLTADGHELIAYRILKDEPNELDALLTEFLGRHDVDVILTNGGTGISKRDQTINVIDRRLTVPLPGFGELFRALSYEQIGSGAMLSRATGGVIQDKFAFAMPGSTKGVELAMTKLILPELRHLLGELRKQT